MFWLPNETNTEKGYTVIVPDDLPNETVTHKMSDYTAIAPRKKYACHVITCDTQVMENLTGLYAAMRTLRTPTPTHETLYTPCVYIKTWNIYAHLYNIYIKSHYDGDWKILIADWPANLAD